MLNYMSVKETAKKWNVSERQVQKLCEEQRISGAIQVSRVWLIPNEASKPIDRRTKKGKENYEL